MARLATEDKRLIRDTNSGAVINTDKAAFSMYKARREHDKKANDIADDVANLKQDMNEIKQMLHSIIRGTDG
jgi:hypothetical protein|tara:strand:- start:1482 stop:1697 length:216 start_codon:yes stop_codon:yes gene_type:complete